MLAGLCPCRASRRDSIPWLFLISSAVSIPWFEAHQSSLCLCGRTASSFVFSPLCICLQLPLPSLMGIHVITFRVHPGNER